MRRLLVLGSVSSALLAIAACAASDDETEAPHAEPDEALADAGAGRDVAVASDAPVEARGAVCSSDGWCETTLPDVGLTIKDIWPLPGRAFALAESRSFGIRALEWNEADSTWRYIDDNSQNEALADHATRIWSPNADEVYYAAAPGTIYHGTRPAPPATAWSWSRERLPENVPDRTEDAKDLILGVWGVGSDIYAWRSNTIFRRASEDGGALGWVPEHTVDDADNPVEVFYITGAAGTRPDEVWFRGYRFGGNFINCEILIRRTPEGYHRIADGVATFRQCTPRDGGPQPLPSPSGASNALSSQFHTSDGRRFFLLQPPNQYSQLTMEGESLSVTVGSVPSAVVRAPRWTATWSESADRLWLAGGGQNARWGVVMRGSEIGDGGSYQYSSTVLNGAPLTKLPTQIRGTSPTNLWAVGEGYALHKTTP